PRPAPPRRPGPRLGLRDGFPCQLPLLLHLARTTICFVQLSEEGGGSPRHAALFRSFVHGQRLASEAVPSRSVIACSGSRTSAGRVQRRVRNGSAAVDRAASQTRSTSASAGGTSLPTPYSTAVRASGSCPVRRRQRPLFGPRTRVHTRCAPSPGTTPDTKCGMSWRRVLDERGPADRHGVRQHRDLRGTRAGPLAAAITGTSVSSGFVGVFRPSNTVWSHS